MSAAIRTGTLSRQFYTCCRKIAKDQSLILQSRSLSWWKPKAKKQPTPPSDDFEKKDNFVNDHLQILKKRTSVQTVKGYQPPSDVEGRIRTAVQTLFTEDGDWRTIELKDRRAKYRLLTKLMKEFDHDIPNMDLNQMNNVDDVVTYFQQEVRDTSALEDMSKFNLPRNMHINFEPIRFNRNDKNNITKGKSAFGEDHESKVFSIKYRRKYRGSAEDQA